MADRLIAGRYRLDSLLGRGGMSEVWCATDTELGRRVALKLLAPNEDIARFEHEARTFAALAHPNVTQVYDYGEADGRPFMVLEYVPGGTLEERLRNGPLADVQTWAVAPAALAGIADAALAKDPSLRPRDGSALLDALDTGIGALQLSTAVPVAETTPTTALPAVSPPRRRRRAFGGALALSLLLLLALAGGVLAYEITRPSADAPTATLPPTTSDGS